MNTRAREQMILENLGLTHHFASRYAHTSVSRDDLMQAGVVGLIKAVDRFDPSLGNAFSTFAAHWILKYQKALIEGNALSGGVELSEAQTLIEEHHDEDRDAVEAHRALALSLLAELDVEHRVALMTEFGIDAPCTSVREQAEASGSSKSTIHRRRASALARLREIATTNPKFQPAL